MSITMKEIASICDVSRGTVDRVLNNRGKVRPETAERILAVARSMPMITRSSTICPAS